MRLLRLAFILFSTLALLGLKVDELKSATQQSGTVTSFSLEDKTMMIGQTEYKLAEHLIVLSKGNVATSDGHIENGKQIEFWVIYDTNTGAATIKKIRLLYDFKTPS